LEIRERRRVSAVDSQRSAKLSKFLGTI
jgi:hypothetical protein